MVWKIVYLLCPVLFILLLFAVSAACYYKDKLDKEEVKYRTMTGLKQQAERSLGLAHLENRTLKKKIKGLTQADGECDDLWTDDCCPDEKMDGVFPAEETVGRSWVWNGPANKEG
jgi:hypothetical protein